MTNDETSPNGEGAKAARDIPSTFDIRASSFIVALQLEIDDAIGCNDAVFVFHVGARAQIN